MSAISEGCSPGQCDFEDVHEGLKYLGHSGTPHDLDQFAGIQVNGYPSGREKGARRLILSHEHT